MEFNITINASREKVWKTLWDDETYRAWTSAFAPGSWAKTDWKKGSKVLFLDAKNEGMTSVVEDNIPNEYMSFRHLGIVKAGVEDTTSDESKEWAGALENYTLSDAGGKTELNVYMHSDKISKEMLDYFTAAWPKALEKLKQLAED